MIIDEKKLAEKIIIWKAIHIDAVDDTDRFIDALIIEREALWKENVELKEKIGRNTRSIWVTDTHSYQVPQEVFYYVIKLEAVARAAEAMNMCCISACGNHRPDLQKALAALKETK